MLVIALAMLAIVLLASAVVAYVAFPSRGEPMPAVPWLGEGMSRIRRALPTRESPDDFFEPPHHP